MKIKIVTQSDIAIGQSRSIDDVYGGIVESGKSKSKRYILIEHAGAKLQWNIPSRTWNNSPDVNASIFDQLNAYLEQLPLEKQAAIFEEYKNIHTVLHSTNMDQNECEDLVEAIRPIAKRLFDIIEPEHFYNWVWTSLRPRIPAAVRTVFDPDTMPGTRERTYLVEDYKGLIPLAIIVRAAVPFWFDFAALTYKNISSEHKDMIAYSLIEQSWPASNQAMARLEEFVDHTIGSERNNPAAIMMGIGTDDFVYWALSSLVINRLTIVDAMSVDDLTPVASALYNYVLHRVKTIASSQPSVKNKFAQTSYSTDENNQSYLEGFRNRIALTVGQEAQGDYYLERQLELIEGKDKQQKSLFAINGRDPLSLLERVAPGIDYNLVKDSLKTAKALHSVELTDEQITIAALLFHPYSQARAVSNLLKGRIVSLLGLAQAVLIHHGKIDMAMLVTAAYELSDNSGGTHFIGESIATLKVAEREKYKAVFPMERRNRKNVKNFVIDSVSDLVYSLQKYDINCTFSEETLRKVQGNNPNRKYFLPRDAIAMFMDYSKWLAERQIVRIDPNEVFQKLITNGGQLAK